MAGHMVKMVKTWVKMVKIWVQISIKMVQIIKVAKTPSKLLKSPHHLSVSTPHPNGQSPLWHCLGSFWIRIKHFGPYLHSKTRFPSSSYHYFHLNLFLLMGLMGGVGWKGRGKSLPRGEPQQPLPQQQPLQRPPQPHQPTPTAPTPSSNPTPPSSAPIRIASWAY